MSYLAIISSKTVAEIVFSRANIMYCCISCCLQRRSFFRNKKAAHFGFFKLQQLNFSLYPSAIAGKTAACSDNAVTWYHKGYRVVTDRTADCLCRHFFDTVLFCYLLCYRAVSCCFAVGDFQHDIAHGFSERR